MGAILLILYFTLLTIGLVYAAGGWGLGIGVILLLAYLLAREVASSHVFDGDAQASSPKR
jgi:hypothetical protein